MTGDWKKHHIQVVIHELELAGPDALYAPGVIEVEDANVRILSLHAGLAGRYASYPNLQPDRYHRKAHFSEVAHRVGQAVAEAVMSRLMLDRGWEVV